MASRFLSLLREPHRRLASVRALIYYPPPVPKSPTIRVLFLIVLCTGSLGVPGCGSVSLKIESASGLVEPQIRTAVYRPLNDSAADIYLSDVPESSILQRLESGVPGSPAHVVHMHVFLEPKAGRTPIDFTASNATITYMVLTGSSRGVYGGGGFLLPADDIGDREYAGRIRQATLRLIESDPGFADRLGLPELQGRVVARRDDELAASISTRMTRLLSP